MGMAEGIHYMDDQETNTCKSSWLLGYFWTPVSLTDMNPRQSKTLAKDGQLVRHWKWWVRQGVAVGLSYWVVRERDNGDIQLKSSFWSCL